MGDAARNLDLGDAAAERLAALLALPLRAEPLTAEESALFDEMEADQRRDPRGHSADEIHATIEQMHRDQGE